MVIYLRMYGRYIHRVLYLHKTLTNSINARQVFKCMVIYIYQIRNDFFDNVFEECSSLFLNSIFYQSISYLFLII